MIIARYEPSTPRNGNFEITSALFAAVRGSCRLEGVPLIKRKC